MTGANRRRRTSHPISASSTGWPSHLPKRLTPPPEREGPPDLTLFLYAGIVLAVILAILAIPYVIGYLFEVLL